MARALNAAAGVLGKSGPQVADKSNPSPVGTDVRWLLYCYDISDKGLPFPRLLLKFMFAGGEIRTMHQLPSIAGGRDYYSDRVDFLCLPP